jgi:bifunctional UDP-N-acetylglucosamine pyrophosphorylase/glucosamine-1-phosphate N-acetyltransferase
MKALLLAAGQSKRMAPLPDKNFLPMCGKPLIAHQIEQLQRCGFDDVIVVGGRHNLEELEKVANEMIGDATANGGAANGKNVRTVEQKNLNDGMAGAVLAAREIIGSEPFLVVSSNDVIEDGAYVSLLRSTTTALLAKKVSSYFPGGYLEVERGVEDGRAMRVRKIVEKPGAGKEPSDLVNIVAHLHRDSALLFEALDSVKTTRDDRYEVALDRMISDGVFVTAVPYSGQWQAIKYPWHLVNIWKLLMPAAKKSFWSGIFGGAGDTHELAKPQISPRAQIAKTATVRGHVVIEEGAKVFDHAVIVGPAYIGKNAIVANNALVRQSHLGEGSVAGFSTEIARSYLGNHVWTHSNYIGDSVISSNSSFGAGATTANLRLDEGNILVNVGDEKIDTGTNKFGIIMGENVRVGVNTSIMPGVKIGNNTFVASGLCVAEDIPDRQFVYGRFTLEKKENRVKLNPSAREVMMRKLLEK